VRRVLCVRAHRFRDAQVLDGVAAHVAHRHAPEAVAVLRTRPGVLSAQSTRRMLRVFCVSADAPLTCRSLPANASSSTCRSSPGCRCTSRRSSAPPAAEGAAQACGAWKHERASCKNLNVVCGVRRQCGAHAWPGAARARAHHRVADRRLQKRQRQLRRRGRGASARRA
jgi:hypothetical protein